MNSRLAAGTQIDGYTIDCFLGEGGMGEVYKAQSPNVDHPVALKLLSADLAQSRDFRDRLIEEARLNALVVSPYVVKVLARGDWDGRPYIAMEFVEGSELRDCADKLDYEQKLDLTCSIGSGISAAHKYGLIHRDLKPENIRIKPDNTPKILDFGLAKTISADEIDEAQLDDDGNIEGTLYYFSPEQLSGEPLTVGTDIFSFGVIVYELLTGRRPFEGDFAASIVYAVLHEDPIPPTDLDSGLPKWVDALTGRLLAKRVQDRFQTIDEAVAFVEDHRHMADASVAGWERPKQKVTVIDLKNRSGDTEWDYFCEGFTEDVIRELARRTDLIVSAEPSTTRRRDLHETFEQYRSDYIVSGSLMRWKDQIKLSLDIHARADVKLVWGETYSDQSDNLFDLLAKAAAEASAKLSEISNSAEVAVEETPQPDVTAYDYYLRGRSYYQTNRPEDLDIAEGMFQKALEVDANLALAHTGLADLFLFRYMAYYDRSKENVKRAFDSATRAIQLDPRLAEAHRSMARYYMFTERLDYAEQSLLTAVALNPKYAVGYRTLGWLKRAQGEPESASSYAQKALELSPTDLETLLLLGLLNMDGRKLTAAMATLQRAIELGPDYGRAYFSLGEVYLKLGAYDPALKNLEFAEKYKGDPNCYIESGSVFLMQGDQTSARTKFQNSIDVGYFPFVAHYYLGLTASLNDDKGEAANQYERALELLEEFDLLAEENLHLRLYRAMALAGCGKQAEAKEIADDIFSRASLPAEIITNLARCYAILGDVQKAKELCQTALGAFAGPTEKELALDPHFRGMEIFSEKQNEEPS